MSFEIEDRRAGRPLPTDITLRVPLYRRRGVIATLVAHAFARWSANRQLRRIVRSRRPATAPPLPDYLRRDIGLPPADARSRGWYEFRW